MRVKRHGHRPVPGAEERLDYYISVAASSFHPRGPGLLPEKALELSPGGEGGDHEPGAACREKFYRRVSRRPRGLHNKL